MDNEEVLIKQNGEGGKGVSFKEIFYILRANLILIIIITVLFGAGGFAYSKLRKPDYTASEDVQFKTEMFSGTSDTENSVNQVSSTNYLFAYLDNAIGICMSGEVLDRANVYYHFYKTSGLKIDEFITEMNNLYTYEKRVKRAEIPGYEVTPDLKGVYRDKVFKSGRVGTTYSTSKKAADVAVNFTIWVKDLNRKEAREMVRIYTLAADIALNQILDLGEDGTAGIIELAVSVDGVNVAPDMSSTNIIIISTVLGFMVSLIVVYLKYLADNTVKGKDQLEKLTGANVIAYLEDVAEVK